MIFGSYIPLVDLPARPWRYDTKVDEFYVIEHDTTLLRKEEHLKELEEVDLGESCMHVTSIKPQMAFNEIVNYIDLYIYYVYITNIYLMN